MIFSVFIVTALVAVSGSLASISCISNSTHEARCSQIVGSTNADDVSTPGAIVMTSSGPVRGEVLPTTYAYRGIPYAAPPVGQRRWRPPTRPDPWTSPRDATRFAPICPQFTTREGRLVFNNTQRQATAGNEDCLALNVWVPKETHAQPLPVMVFIHGGGFVQGSSSRYDGAALSERGVIVVTINYRLGAFGFLAHPALSKEDLEKGISGNYGILDQIAALQWVKENIRAFGGDPDNVTIFGESAGAASVSILLASPLARGLFHRAIMQSGVSMTRRTLSVAEAEGIHFAAAAGCENATDVLECLRGKTQDELLNTLSPSPASQELFDIASGKQRYGPVVDGVILPATPLKMFQHGQYNAVPVIIGTNANEGTIFLEGVRRWSKDIYETSVRRIFGRHAPELLELYPVSRYASPKQAFDALLTDLMFICPARLLAQILATHQPKSGVYLYRFNHSMERGLIRRLGAFHGLELAFLFRFGVIPGLRPTPQEMALSDAMTDYWIQFARTGDPNVPGLPRWPQYMRDREEYLVLDVPITTARGLGREDCPELFRAIFP